ncbi:M56 family metallopeptidase [Algibacillus agarilyticus]|uniref:M56 family metallopeptidase n=1 Tax=Algibacillus agarilyticus TaxID=2234133 RepID=UPI000DD06689|nr:M56 family metallopeptidase [Algibacillus agarilyticus]
MDYWLTNLSISTIVWLTLKYTKDAPLRLHLCLISLALICWLLPWQMIQWQSNIIAPMVFEHLDYLSFMTDWQQNAQSSNHAVTSLQTDPPIDPNSQFSLLNFSLTTILSWVLASLCAAGAVRLVIDILQHFKQINGWHQQALPYQKVIDLHALSPVSSLGRYVQVKALPNGAPGMTTGFIAPVIWVNVSYINDDKLDAILRHELHHIRHFDVLWKWGLNIISRLFWWNPIITYWALQADQHIELICDQACYQQMGDDYGQALAAIMLAQQQEPSAKFVGSNMMPAMTHQTAFNIRRLQKLKKENVMKMRTILAAMASILVSSLAVAQLNTSTVASSAQMSGKWESRPANIQIYTDNAAYNQQIDELVALSKHAKSEDFSRLNQTYIAVTNWFETRDKLDKYFEKRMWSSVLTLQNYLLDTMERHEDRLALLQATFPNEAKMPLFFRHHLSTAYMKTGQPAAAMHVWSYIDFEKHTTKPGTKILVGQIFLANEDYQNAIMISDKYLEWVERTNKPAAKRLALVNKYQALRRLGENDLADNIAEQFAKQFGIKIPEQPLHIPKQWAPVLGYI